MKNTFQILIVSLAIFNMLSTAHGETASSVTQYGITWKFDKEYNVGKFITGDYWVVGPVKVVSVTPTPGPAPKDEPITKEYPLKNDKTMRNGSMIINRIDWLQGHDSRLTDYRAILSVSFPCDLQQNQTLLSTISSEAYENGTIQTPNMLAEQGIFYTPKKDRRLLEAAAVLTCLEKRPPADAFRPPYVGKDKPIYQAKDIRWDLLPKLKPVASTPAWKNIERIFERPWTDYYQHHWCDNMAPAQNQPIDGPEFCRMTSYAALMLLLDVPQEQKQKLMYSFLQLGIDLSGCAKSGRSWSAEGIHNQGRKWPILFASIMLDKPEIRQFPLVRKAGQGEKGAQPATLFQEDMDTYYGKVGDGPPSSLCRIFAFYTWHSILSFEKSGDQTSQWRVVDTSRKSDKEIQDTGAESGLVNTLYAANVSSWAGNALAALYMKGKAIWNHDAYFDYEDFWMSDKNTLYSSAKWAPKGCSKTVDLFVEEMWNAYRKGAPTQPGGKDNLNWEWVKDSELKGHFITNGTEDPQPSKK